MFSQTLFGKIFISWNAILTKYTAKCPLFFEKNKFYRLSFKIYRSLISYIGLILPFKSEILLCIKK